jgi:methylated-DNA-[protein]-cysteine S-methyltransferase
MTYRTTLDTEFGTLTIAGDDEAVTHLELPGTTPPSGPAPTPGPQGLPEPVRAARAQLTEYLGGRRTTFDIPLSFGGTAFQHEVWAALAGIPYGETISYAELARRVGRPQAFRAVGQANGANPLPIFLPCHRVLASGGKIGGYGGGLPLKRRLLALEGVAGDR